MENEIKAAIALLVKNEVNDIVNWISWHLAIGFDKIFIYDDHSEDGTYEVCVAASKIFNIEVNRTDIKEETNFFWRQKKSYFDACQKAKNNFNWVAFIDSDEYIYLEKEKNISDFLSNYKNCNAIALNWCIYGSSSRVIKDHIPIYENFNHHSDKNLNDNRLVKSIIRPEDYSYNYSDPHRFFMDNEIYHDSCGNIVEWNNSTKDITWENARVNHYLCRSMEHYVARIKRRLGVDIHNSTVYWQHFDRNEIHEFLRRDFCDYANQINEKIKEICIKTYINNEQIKNLVPYKGLSKYKGKTFYLKTKYNKYLCVNNIDGNVIQTEDITNEKFKIKAVIYNNELNFLYILKEENHIISNIYFNILSDERKSYCYKYNIEIDDSKRIFLKSTKTDKYLCFVPLENGGDVSCNRDENSDWEEVILEECNDNFETSSLNFSITDFNSFKQYINSGYYISYNDFMVNISDLNKADKERIIFESNNILKWIL